MYSQPDQLTHILKINMRQAYMQVLEGFFYAKYNLHRLSTGEICEKIAEIKFF